VRDVNERCNRVLPNACVSRRRNSSSVRDKETLPFARHQHVGTFEIVDARRDVTADDDDFSDRGGRGGVGPRDRRRQRRGRSPVAARHGTGRVRPAPGAQVRLEPRPVRVQRPGGDTAESEPVHVDGHAERQGHTDH